MANIPVPFLRKSSMWTWQSPQPAAASLARVEAGRGEGSITSSPRSGLAWRGSQVWRMEAASTSDRAVTKP